MYIYIIIYDNDSDELKKNYELNLSCTYIHTHIIGIYIYIL